jgi:N-acyl-D-aspartate/D-glutamate deacylase
VAKVAASYGGTYSSHIRGEGEDVVKSVDELIEIADQAKIPAQIYHIKVAYKPGCGTMMQTLGAHIAAARARGLDVTDNMYVYDAAGTGLESTIPIWAHEGGREKLQERLHDPAIRARLKQEQTSGYPGWWNMVASSGGWDGVVLVNALNETNRKYENKSIAEIGREMGKDPADAAFDLVMEADEGDRRVLAVYHMMCEQDIATALRFPWTAFGSDGGSNLLPGGPAELAHPRAYNNFPRVIARYVREKQVLTLEDAVRRMSSLAAGRMRLEHRGMIRVGDWADVTIFDYEGIQDHATYQHPAAYADGIPYVLVNGQVVVDQGRHNGAKPGMVLYGPGYAGAR